MVKYAILAAKRLGMTAAGFVLLMGPHAHLRMQLQQQIKEQRQQLAQLQMDSTVPGSEPWMMSGFDMVQNSKIFEINEHLKATDATVTKLGEQLVLTQREVSDMAGTDKVWFSLLSVMVIGMIGMEFWKETRKGESK